MEVNGIGYTTCDPIHKEFPAIQYSKSEKYVEVANNVIYEIGL